MKPGLRLERRSPWRTTSASALATVAILAAPAMLLLAGGTVAAQAPAAASPPPIDPASCNGMLTRSDQLAATLSGVPRYGSSYVLIVPQRLAEKVPSGTAPGVKDLQVGVHAGTPAVDVARAAGITRIREYAQDPTALVQPLQDAQAGTIDAAILWAPLAGLGIMELGLDGQVSIFTLDRPHPGPSALQAAAAAPSACGAAIADDLDASGVLPAELLVALDFRDFLTRKPPAFSLADARRGEQHFNQVCARCHGPNAVADPHGLAPVDLRLSIPRFGFPGFAYIVLNGRPPRSMPPLRGTVSEDEVALIYQYLRARSQKLL